MLYKHSNTSLSVSTNSLKKISLISIVGHTYLHNILAFHHFQPSSWGSYYFAYLNLSYNLYLEKKIIIASNDVHNFFLLL